MSEKKVRFQRGLKEILEALEKVKPGDTIVVRPKSYLIDMVLWYDLGDFQWLNLVSHDCTGREIVFEVAEGKIRRWDEIAIPGATVNTETLEYKGEKYEQGEKSTARVTISSMNQEGTKKIKVPYSVFETDSGNRLSVEEKDGKITVYFSEEIIQPFTVQVP